jgi:hypothetical protein
MRNRNWKFSKPWSLSRSMRYKVIIFKVWVTGIKLPLTVFCYNIRYNTGLHSRYAGCIFLKQIKLKSKYWATKHETYMKIHHVGLLQNCSIIYGFLDSKYNCVLGFNRC